jgi:hypothetical protein
MSLLTIVGTSIPLPSPLLEFEEFKASRIVAPTDAATFDGRGEEPDAVVGELGELGVEPDEYDDSSELRSGEIEDGEFMVFPSAKIGRLLKNAPRP